MALETKLNFCNDFMVVIDTNCFEDYTQNKKITPYCAQTECDDFFKKKKSNQRISNGLYFITQSVFGEIIQQRKEYLENAVETLKKALKPFGKEFNFPTDINFEEDLKKYLKDYHINILPHPDNNVFPRIIQRAIDKKLPFKLVSENKNNASKGSDNGFKDVLLWETLLSFDYESKRIGKVFLITANHKDFPINDLLPEWNKFHPCIELSILQNWKDFIKVEETILSELIAQNNIEYSSVLDLFQGENPDIIELLNFKKKITGRKNSPIVEIETDVKKKDGAIYSATYFYDIRVNEPTLFDPDEYDNEQETTDAETVE